MKILMIVLCLIFVLHLSAIIINIPDDQPTIQAGIGVAVSGDSILVYPGDYQEMINFNGKNITVASLYLTTQDTTYISQTIIDPCQPCYVVTFESGEDSTSVLYGLTITNSESFSKGIVCIDSSPKLDSNVILDISANCSYHDGGGISLSNSNAIIINNVIANNYVHVPEEQTSGGAGISIYSSSPLIMNNTIQGNSVYAETWPQGGGHGWGAGIYCKLSYPIISKNKIHENTMEGGSVFGGGIGLYMCDSFEISENTISYNYSNTGGGVYSYYSNGEISDNYILNNYTSINGYGGGGRIDSGDVSIINNVVCNNSSGRGGGFRCRTNYFANNTICNNFATHRGGAIYGSGCNPIFYNNIFFGNNSVEGSQISLPDGYYTSNPEFYYNNIEGGLDAIHGNNTSLWIYENNINESPEFAYPTTGSGYQYNALQSDWNLTQSSPCIDAANPDTTGLNLSPWDIIGNQRIWDGDGNGIAIIDMGAYEYGSPPYVDVDDNVIVHSLEAFLHQNYPNPFNPTTTIEFSIQEESKINLSVYNIKGQRIKTLAFDEFDKGDHSIVWNGENDFGKSVSSGIYYYQLKVNGKTVVVKKCLLLK